MAVYTPKNSKDVEAIQLPLNYTRDDLGAVARWLARNAPNTTFEGQSRRSGTFEIVIRTIFSSLVVEPSNYISIDPATTQLKLWSAESFEEEYSPKFTAGTINAEKLRGYSVKMPPTCLHGTL